jgi:hypothetical protein
MAGTLERPLSQTERLDKARSLVDQGAQDFRAAEAAESELEVRRRAALACETAFHGLVELAHVLLERAGHVLPENHDQRIEALEDIGRHDLATLYSEAFQALHISGYNAQRAGRLQRDRLRAVAEALERELRKLG